MRMRHKIHLPLPIRRVILVDDNLKGAPKPKRPTAPKPKKPKVPRPSYKGKEMIKSFNKKVVGFFLYGLALLAIISTQDAYAFNEKLYNELSNNGKAYVVEVYSTMCSICQTQKKILKNSNVPVLVVDYYRDQKWVKHFKAPLTAILGFKGKTEKFRTVGQTDPNVILGNINKL